MSDIKSNNGWLKGPLITVANNSGWAIANVGIAYLSKGLLAAWLYALGSIIFLFILQSILGTRFSFSELLNAFIYGVFQSITMIGLFFAFQEDNPAIAVTIVSFAAVLGVVVFSPILGEKITFHVIFMAVIGTGGVVLISLKSLGSWQLSSGAIIALLILPIISSNTFVLRKTQKKVEHEKTGFYSFVWLLFFSSIILPFVNESVTFTKFEVLIMVGTVVTGSLGHMLYGVAQKHTAFSTYMIIARIQAPLTALFAWVFINKILQVHQMIGMVIVIIVCTYVAIASRKEKLV